MLLLFIRFNRFIYFNNNNNETTTLIIIIGVHIILYKCKYYKNRLDPYLKCKFRNLKSE